MVARCETDARPVLARAYIIYTEELLSSTVSLLEGVVLDIKGPVFAPLADVVHVLDRHLVLDARLLSRLLRDHHARELDLVRAGGGLSEH